MLRGCRRSLEANNVSELVLVRPTASVLSRLPISLVSYMPLACQRAIGAGGLYTHASTALIVISIYY